MKGILHIIPANPEASQRVIVLDRPVTHEELIEAVGGSVGFIANFDTIKRENQVSLCYAFCDEQAKARERPLNRWATALWSQALVRRFGYANAELPELLLGSVAIITGDSEFLEAL